MPRATDASKIGYYIYTQAEHFPKLEAYSKTIEIVEYQFIVYCLDYLGIDAAT